MEGTKQPPKVKAVYQAVIALFAEGADLNSLTVAEIAERARFMSILKIRKR